VNPGSIWGQPAPPYLADGDAVVDEEAKVGGRCGGAELVLGVLEQGAAAGPGGGRGLQEVAVAARPGVWARGGAQQLAGGAR